MIISRTPVRVSFFGGGTDYPEYFRKNGGGMVVDPRLPEEVFAALRDLLEDEERQRELSVSGKRRAAAFSWCETARETLGIYRELCQP